MGAPGRIHSGHGQVHFFFFNLSEHVCTCVSSVFSPQGEMCVCGAVILILRTQAASLCGL